MLMAFAEKIKQAQLPHNPQERNVMQKLHTKSDEDNKITQGRAGALDIQDRY